MIFYGLLNYKRRFKQIKKYAQKLQEKGLVVCTDDATFWDGYETIVARETVAQCKNDLLNIAKQKKAKYAVLLEDDTYAVSNDTYYEYISLMEKYDLSFSCFGYSNPINTVFDKKPNPIIDVIISDSKKVIVNRFPGNALIVMKISDDMEMFDERLNVLETENLLFQSYKKKSYPFHGFVFDIDESWKKIEKIYDGNKAFPKVRVVSQALIEKDIQIINDKNLLTLNPHATDVLKHIISRGEQ